MSLLDKNCMINRYMTIREAMYKIDAGFQKTVFLTENGVLQGCLTDGDVRRHLLDGGSIDDNVCQIVNFSPKYFRREDKRDYQEYMISNMISALPIVDDSMQLIRIETLNSRCISYEKIDENIPVIMMAGGLGTRLKPYTEIIPKPLIPIGSKTITEHIFDKFGKFGCDVFFMIVNYKKSLIEAYFKDSEKYPNLKFVEEPFFMGTVGGVRLLKEKIQENFFLVNCDILVDCDYCQIWKEHIKHKNIMTLVSAKKVITIPYGTVIADKNDEVCDFVEKPKTEYNINTGLYLCSSKIFEYISEQEKLDMPELIKRCINAKERVGQFLIDEDKWYDMGQLEELELMKKAMHNIG